MAKNTTAQTSNPQSKRLTRSSTDKVLAGVCGGLGKYFEIDSTIVRIIFVLMAFFGGFGFVLYIVLALVMPSDTDPTERDVVADVKKNAEEIGETVKTSAEKFRNQTQNNPTTTRNWLGVILIVLGVLFVLSNFGFFNIFNVGRLWPVILIVIGLVILLRERE